MAGTISNFYNHKSIKKNTNSTQNKSQTRRARAYKVTSFLSTDCELSTETCSRFLYSLGPLYRYWFGMSKMCSDTPEGILIFEMY